MSLDARAWILLISLAAVGVKTSTAATVCPSHLEFLKSKCSQWQADILPESIPPARGNAVADSDAAAALGMKVFYDNRFSKSGTGVACANCHDPEHSFAEQKPTSHTINGISRNAPDLINAAWYTQAHFWDGKVDNVWSAPLFTFEQDDEMGATRLGVVHTLAAIYKMRYEKIFGTLPDMSDEKRFPATGKPGMPQFDAMSEDDKNLVNQAYANLGKSLEAYVRKLAAGRSKFDDFMNGSPKSLSPAAQQGMLAFTRYACDSCHSGPTFTDEGFHNLRAAEKPGSVKDPGHAGGLEFARHWQFTSSGKFADPTAGTPEVKPSRAGTDTAGFRTPSLRNVSLTAPYGHDGSYATLDEVIAAHTQVLPKRTPPSAQERQDLIEFLRSLSGRPPQAPWSSWPGG